MQEHNRTRRGARITAGLLASAIIAGLTGTIPVATAATAPVVYCAQAFGHEIPAAPCERNPNQLTPSTHVGRTYPNSYLYITSTGTGQWAYPRKGTFWIEGNATPGATVEITVTDGVITRGPYYVKAAAQGSPSGPRAGDWRMEVPSQDGVAFGAHRATPGADADSTGDDELGPTLLTIAMTPRLGADVGTTKTTTITKHAATAGDVTKPQLSGTKFPPSTWERNCPLSLATNAPFYAFEGALYLLGLGTYPRDDMPCASATIEGQIREDGSTVPGSLFSEISDVRIQIRKGGQTYLDVRDSVEGAQMRSRGKGGILARDSSNYATYRWQMTSHQLPPNNLAQYGMDSYYVVTVTVCDAWGDVMAATPSATNCTVLNSGNITVTPY